jgi:acyl-CoA reductase-like NAD-dependent aldehyde dehydrogenase
MVETVETFENLIDGKWTRGRSSAVFENENPAACGSNLGRFQSSTPDDVVAAIDAATAAFRVWRRTPVSDRQAHVAEQVEAVVEAIHESWSEQRGGRGGRRQRRSRPRYSNPA